MSLSYNHQNIIQTNILTKVNNFIIKNYIFLYIFNILIIIKILNKNKQIMDYYSYYNNIIFY